LGKCAVANFGALSDYGEIGVMPIRLTSFDWLADWSENRGEGLQHRAVPQLQRKAAIEVEE